jgi:thiol-disulfide isomerase/thioredoxin
MMGSGDEAKQQRSPRRIVHVAAAALVGVSAGLAGIYGIAAVARNPTNSACPAAVETVQRLAPLSRGEVAAVAVASDPRPVPDLAFRDASGGDRTLSEWRGRTVLFNLWATWCVPCRREMPALDALQGRLGGPNFEVVAVNIDTRNLEKPKTWLKEMNIDRLSYYADPSAKTFQDLKAVGKALGMPTTLLIDPNGCELGTLAGPAEWASDDAIKLVEAALLPPTR